MIPPVWLEEAAARVAEHLVITPLTHDPDLDIFLKWENRQRTGSFKARGALNKVLGLQPWELEAGLVTASAGNHGQGVALAAGLAGARVTVFASEAAVPAKLAAMRERGAVVRLVQGGYAEAEQAGIRYAQEHGATWVSPYNDGQVIAGQGTLGLEILAQCPPQPGQVWLVPAGGGGLAAGLAVALQSAHPHRPKLVAVQSDASAFLHALWHGQPQSTVHEEPSLADGLAGAVEEGSLTIPMTRQGVDEFVLVTEEEIGQAVAFAWRQYSEVIEPSAAVGLAAILSGRVSARPAVVIVSGGNIQPEVHARLIANSGDSIPMEGSR